MELDRDWNRVRGKRQGVLEIIGIGIGASNGEEARVGTGLELGAGACSGTEAGAGEGAGTGAGEGTIE